MISARRFEETRTVNLPVGVVWSVMADTDRLNQAIGLGEVAYGRTLSDRGAIYREASTRLKGVTLRWREYPFDWEQGKGYSVVRIYEGGPIERFDGGTTLKELGPQQTEVTVWTEIKARSLAGGTLVGPMARNFVFKTLSVMDSTLFPGESQAAKRGMSTAGRLRIPPPRPTPANLTVLNRLSGALRSAPLREKYVDLLCAYIRDGGDEDVINIRPFFWADGLGLSRDEALRTCLHAVKAGLLNLRWSLMCPNCRVAKHDTSTLRDVETSVHCDLCGVSFGLNFDRFVELCFAVHPAVRPAKPSVFCVAGPARSPHILMQRTLRPGQVQTLDMDAPNIQVRLRTLRSNKVMYVEPGAPRLPILRFQAEGWDLPKGGFPARVENCTDEEITVVLELVEWDDAAVTAARVMALQEFRDLFSSEVLRPGREIGVECLTLFFSDLGNSTALYERIGDAPAFSRVGQHFDYLTNHIAANRGAVVKTMGDAVMAVFLTPENAMAAAIAMHRDFEKFARGHEGIENVYLKIGLHYGPALAVTQNDRLDYFGRTVNIAARVSSASRGGDIAFTSAIHRDEAVQKLLSKVPESVTSFKANFRGVEEEMLIYRVDFH